MNFKGNSKGLEITFHLFHSIFLNTISLILFVQLKKEMSLRNATEMKWLPFIYLFILLPYFRNKFEVFGTPRHDDDGLPPNSSIITEMNCGEQDIHFVESNEKVMSFKLSL